MHRHAVVVVLTVLAVFALQATAVAKPHPRHYVSPSVGLKTFGHAKARAAATLVCPPAGEEATFTGECPFRANFTCKVYVGYATVPLNTPAQATATVSQSFAEWEAGQIFAYRTTCSGTISDAFTTANQDSTRTLLNCFS